MLTIRELDSEYWSKRYLDNQIQWDIGYVSTPLKEYFDQLRDKSIRILIPGAGNSYEAEYLHNQGFCNVYVADVSEVPLKNLKDRCPDFPEDHLLLADFFELDLQFDLIIEQTFFCALNPSMRDHYVSKMYELLNSRGKLVGVLFNAALNADRPPFGGFKDEYTEFFKGLFDSYVFEECYNSIPPRRGRELFINLQKKA